MGLIFNFEVEYNTDLFLIWAAREVGLLPPVFVMGLSLLRSPGPSEVLCILYQ